MGAGARTQASELPHTVSAPAMIQASRGGLVKYPNASSRDHAQYCASSKNRSTTENFRPISRMTVSAAISAAARPKLGIACDRLLAWDVDAIDDLSAKGAHIGPAPGSRQGHARFPDAVQRHKRSYARLRALWLLRSGAPWVRDRTATNRADSSF